MVQRIIKLAEDAAKKATGILFADPNFLYIEQRHLINKPFFFAGSLDLPAEQAGHIKKGILLVHGWTSTPYEVRRLGEYLNAAGYTALGIQLTGHGTVPKDLEGVNLAQWNRDILTGYEKLQLTCDKVYIGGTSIGANLAMIFAKERPDVAGLILMAAPYKMRLEKAGIFATKIMLHFGNKYRKKFYPPTFGVSTTITRTISYQTYPVSSVLEAFEAVKEARKDLFKITQPCFVLQSTHDHIVARDSMEKIYMGVGSAIKKKKYIEKAYHTFISDIKNEHVFRDILEFLDEN